MMCSLRIVSYSSFKKKLHSNVPPVLLKYNHEKWFILIYWPLKKKSMFATFSIRVNPTLSVPSAGHEVNIGAPPSSPSSVCWQSSPRHQRGPPAEGLLGTKGKDEKQWSSVTLGRCESGWRRGGTCCKRFALTPGLVRWQSVSRFVFKKIRLCSKKKITDFKHIFTFSCKGMTRTGLPAAWGLAVVGGGLSSSTRSRKTCLWSAQ